VTAGAAEKGRAVEIARRVSDQGGEGTCSVAAAGGFLELKDGKPVATGIDGCDGYLLWCAVNEPKNYMALLARVLPYYVSPPEPTGKGIMTYEETLARLRERGRARRALRYGRP